MGEENAQDNAPSRKISHPSKRASGVLSLGSLHKKNKATTPEGGGQRTRRRGFQDPFLGGLSFVRFSAPSFFSTRNGVL